MSVKDGGREAHFIDLSEEHERFVGRVLLFVSRERIIVNLNAPGESQSLYIRNNDKIWLPFFPNNHGTKLDIKQEASH